MKATMIYDVTYTCGHTVEQRVRVSVYSQAGIAAARAGIIERKPLPAVVKCPDCLRLEAVREVLTIRRDRETPGSLAHGCVTRMLELMAEHPDWQGYAAALRASVGSLRGSWLLSKELREAAIEIYEDVINMVTPVGFSLKGDK